MHKPKEIIQHLLDTQREAIENKKVEEISKSELDQIFGARGDWFVKGEWRRAI